MKTILISCTAPDERAEMALLASKELGYRRVFAGDAPDEVIRALADVCHEISWDDTDALTRIAEKEKADGIVGLCDKAMIPASKACQALGLPGNTPECVETLISKNAFRDLQERAGVFHPGHFVCDTAEGIEEKSAALHFPLIVKPVQCSSSFGQTVVRNEKELADAFSAAAARSQNGRVCVEEFITQTSLRAVELDVFVFGEDILWDGIRDSYRVESAPLRPIYDVYPAGLSVAELEKIRSSVRALLAEAGFVLGECNIEGFFTEKGEFFVIEINPRQAGYYNPQHVQLCTGVDLTKLLVTTAMGDNSYYEELRSFRRTKRNLLAYSVFSPEAGILDRVHIDGSLLPHLLETRYPLGRKEGLPVPDILTAVRPISIAVFAFDSAGELEEARKRISDLVYPVLRS